MNLLIIRDLDYNIDNIIEEFITKYADDKTFTPMKPSTSIGLYEFTMNGKKITFVIVIKSMLTYSLYDLVRLGQRVLDRQFDGLIIMCHEILNTQAYCSHLDENLNIVRRRHLKYRVCLQSPLDQGAYPIKYTSYRGKLEITLSHFIQQIEYPNFFELAVFELIRGEENDEVFDLSWIF
jgi:hypothetical protein